MSFRDELGITVDDKGEGRARLSVIAEERHLNDGRIVHGGVIATLADCAMGSALASTLDEGEQPVTVEMKINYMEAARPGRLVAEGIVKRKGARFTVLEAEVLQEETGEAVALATATFTLIS